MKKLLLGAVALFALAACSETASSARQLQVAQSEQQMAQAEMAVGPASVTNFQERDFAIKVMEARDSVKLETFVYSKANNGKFVCMGKALGFGLPYGVQTTPPDKAVYRYSGDGSGVVLANPEPNGLYMPASAEASWVRMIGPDGKPTVVYAEERLTITPFPLPRSAVEVPCAD